MKVSLVVPVRDEVETLPTLFASIERLSRPPDEIVFVDGGSRDGTVDLLRSFRLRDVPARVIEAGDATPGRGRNVGIEAATCDWVALTDAGIRLDPLWLERLVATTRHDGDADVVYGTYEVEPGRRFTDWEAIAFVPARHQVPGGMSRGPSIASCLLRRQAWQDAGGFPDLRSGEDLLFMRRLDDIGATVAWSPDATVFWELPTDLRRLFTRFRVYSFNGVLAGLASEWQFGVARYYLLSALFLYGALKRSRWWLTGPVGVLTARALRQCWRHRNERRGAFAPTTVAAVAGLTLVIDIATAVGWAQAERARRRSQRTTQPGPSK